MGLARLPPVGGLETGAVPKYLSLCWALGLRRLGIEPSPSVPFAYLVLPPTLPPFYKCLLALARRVCTLGCHFFHSSL